MKENNINTQFLEMYNQHGDAIFRHCFFKVGYDREKALDLTQETFTKTWDYMCKGNIIENPKAFLYKVATNLVINLGMKKKEISLEVLQDKGFDPGFDNREGLANFIAGKHALDELKKLDEKYSRVIIMRYIDDLTPKEIALALGESENRVSVRIHRGLKKLKEIVKI